MRPMYLMGSPLSFRKSAVGRRTLVVFATAVAFGCGPVSGLAAPVFDLTFVAPAQPTSRRTEPMTSYRFAVGPFALGRIATLIAEGPLLQTAFKIDAPDQSTLQLLLPLRDQIMAAGFTVIYECETQACGGFDFRFGTEVIAEPDMHVDLGDFRYLAATRNAGTGDELLSLMVSKSPDHGFVQFTQVGSFAKAAPRMAAATMSRDLNTVPLVAPAPVTRAGGADGAGVLAATLDQGLQVVLEDLVFASGSSALSPGDFASLRDLAAWLRGNPGRTVSVVGHTDASGSVSANLSLSKLRAQSVRQRLIADFAIPAAQITADGVGSSVPRDTNATNAGRQKNRRVEVMTTPTP